MEYKRSKIGKGSKYAEVLKRRYRENRHTSPRKLLESPSKLLH